MQLVERGADRGATSVEYALVSIGLVSVLMVVSGVLSPAIRIWYDQVFCRLAGRCEHATEGAGTSVEPWNSPDPLTRATWGGMVVMGDSYSSGEGDGAYGVAGSSESCHASANAGGPIVADHLGMSRQLSVVACTGAETSAITSGYATHRQHPQLDAIDDRTSLITLSIGGNDLAWGDIIAACAANHLPDNSVTRLPRSVIPESLRPPARSCVGGASGQVGAAIADLGPTLARTYAAIRDRAPHARVLVMGYPRFFPSSPAHELLADGQILIATPAEQRWMNAETARANRAIDEAAELAGFEFVDVGNALDGHELTSASPWMFGADLALAVPPREQHDFHPTPDGQRALGRVLEQQVRSPAAS